MSIFVVGINHKTAPIALREQVYFSNDKLALYLQDILNQGIASEAVLLSTCNRSELYCETQDICAAKTWFIAQTALPEEKLAASIYVYQDEQAIAHIMQVACGLDSMVLGEPQVLGQMKVAFSESCTAATIDSSFHRLFQQVFETAKEIRTTTAIGACPVSVASAAIHFAKQQVALQDANVVVIGAGDTSVLLLKYLQSTPLNTLTLVNRSLEKASHLIEDFTGAIYGLNKLELALEQADLVFSATGSPKALIDQVLINKIMSARLNRPLTLIDIAVPRDVEPTVKEVGNVALFCIDDLKAIIENHHQGREHAAKKARELIVTRSQNFIMELNALDKVTHAICAYRGQIEEICRQELIKAKRQLHQGADPMLVLDAFAHAFTKKLLHTPSVQLRQAGVEGRFELLRFAKQLFAIPDIEIERL